MVVEEREVTVFCDMHAHFRVKEAFMYCCSLYYDNVMYDSRSKNAFLRVLPLLLSQRNSNFSFNESKFRMEKFKESTARIVLFREFGILNCVTLENSFLYKKLTEVEFVEEEKSSADEIPEEISPKSIPCAEVDDEMVRVEPQSPVQESALEDP